MDPLKELVEQKLKERGWTESDLTPRFLEAGFGKRDPVLHSPLAGRTYDSEAFDVLCRALDIRDDELRTALEERLARLEAERDAALDRLHDPLVDFSETARDTEQRAEPIRLWLGVPQLEAPAAGPPLVDHACDVRGGRPERGAWQHGAPHPQHHERWRDPPVCSLCRGRGRPALGCCVHRSREKPLRGNASCRRTTGGRGGRRNG